VNSTFVADVLRELAPLGSPLGPAAAAAMAGYMVRFEHLDDVRSKEDLRKKVRELQGLLGVEQDGWVGEETLYAAQNAKRCGLRTVAKLGGQANRFRPGLVVNLYFAGYIDGGFSRETQEAETLQAFGSWETVSGVRFNLTRDSNRAHIVIDASSDPREEFGVIGQVLAWCEMPWNTDFTGRLRMKFDRKENWTPKFYRGTCSHEGGHGIGIDHTTLKAPQQLMFAYFQDAIVTPQNPYDISEASRRYPGPVAPPQPVPPGPVPLPADLVTITCRRPVTVNGVQV
jgi:hypothetical protein